MQIGKVTVLDVNLDVSIRDLYSEIKIFSIQVRGDIWIMKSQFNICCSWGLLKV